MPLANSCSITLRKNVTRQLGYATLFQENQKGSGPFGRAQSLSSVLNILAYRDSWAVN